MLPLSPAPVLVAATLFLTMLGTEEGSAQTVNFCPTVTLQGGMHTALRNAGSIPLAQPYGTDGGSVSFAAAGDIPSDMVDWVLLVVHRYGQDIVLGSTAAVLHSDGSVTDTAGNRVSMFVSAAGGFCLELVHRNHLPVASTTRLIPDSNDDVCSDLGAMLGGNAVRDLRIDVADLNALGVAWQQFVVYGQADFTMNGLVDASDLNILGNNWQVTVDTPCGEIILPVELGSFSQVVEGADVVLLWETISESNNAGFSVEISESGTNVWTELAFVDGYGSTNVPRSYVYRARDLKPGLHRFRLKQVDFDGAFEYSAVVEAAVTVPDQFLIEAAYPNPFNPSTTLRFAVATEKQVEVTLVNSVGQEIRTLFRGTVAANEMQQLTVDAASLPSGAYLVHFEGNGLSATERILLTK